MKTKLLFSLLLVLAFLVPCAAEASPILTLSSDGQKISRLAIGDHLEVTLDNATPGELYEFRLRDTDFYEIAEGSAVADAAGRVPTSLLWAYTGVVGCDYPPFVPADYHFQHFNQAEAALNLRTLTVQVLSSSGVEVALQNITLIAVTRELAYFSDASGCLRRRFGNSESVYLSLRHPSRTTPTRKFFLVSGWNPTVGSDIVDVRGDGGTTYTLPTGSTVTFQIWSGAASVMGFYSGLVRWEANTTPIVMSSDRLLNPKPHPGFLPTPPGGLVITIDGCPSCDP